MTFQVLFHSNFTSTKHLHARSEATRNGFKHTLCTFSDPELNAVSDTYNEVYPAIVSSGAYLPHSYKKM